MGWREGARGRLAAVRLCCFLPNTPGLSFEVWLGVADVGLMREGHANRSFAPRLCVRPRVAAFVVGLGLAAAALWLAVPRGRVRSARDHPRRDGCCLQAEGWARSPGCADPVRERRDRVSARSRGRASKSGRSAVATLLFWLALFAAAFWGSAAITTSILGGAGPAVPRAGIVRVAVPHGLPSPRAVMKSFIGQANGR